MENKKLPSTETYAALPHQIQAHQLRSKDQLGDVHWSGFFVGAAVLVTDLDRFGKEAPRQAIAQPGDYLVWRPDNRGWKDVIKQKEFESNYRPATQQTNFEKAFELLCTEKFGDMRSPEDILQFYKEGICFDRPASP